MGLPILGLCGNAGSGKNYIASIISKNFNTVEVALSDPIKRFLNRGLLINEEILWGESSLRERTLEHIPNGLEYAFESTLPLFIKELIDNTNLSEYRASHLQNACVHWFQDIKSTIKKKTCRQLLQEFGTDVCRNVNNDIWAEYATNVVLTILSERRQYSSKLGVGTINSSSYPDLVIVTDVRFANELIAIKKNGGKICQVISTDPKIHQHISETEQLSFPRHWFDYILINDKNVTQEYAKKLFNSRVINMANQMTLSNWI